MEGVLKQRLSKRAAGIFMNSSLASSCAAINDSNSTRSSESSAVILSMDFGAFVADQSQVGLVNQCGGLQSVAGSLAAQMLARDPPQLLIDERQ